VVKAYLKNYGLTHRTQSVQFAEARLAHVTRLLGNLVLSDLTEDAIHGYIRRRLSDGMAGRTVNMEIGELSRAIGQKWSLLWPKIRKLEERKDVGRALSPEEQRMLLAGLETRPSPILQTLVPLLLLTGMRAGEATALT
jgi:integrase